jgi:hypothetical protein
MDDININEVIYPQTQLQRTLDQYIRRSPLSETLATQDSYTHATSSITGTTTDDHTDTQTVDSNNDYEVAPTNYTLHIHDIVLLTRILKDIFVHSWTNEQKKYEEKLMKVKMTKFSKMALTTKSTDEAAAIVANEPSADMKLIEELIEKKVNEKTKKLQMELNATKQKLQRQQNSTNTNTSAKNVRGGEKSTRPNNNQQNRQPRETNQHSSKQPTRSNSRSLTPRRNVRNSTTNNRTKNTPRPRQLNQQIGSTQNTNNGRNNNNRQSTPGKRNATPRRQPGRKKVGDPQQGTSNGNASNRQKSNKRLSNTRNNNNSSKSTKRPRQQN